MWFCATGGHEASGVAAHRAAPIRMSP
jgi:hypothetical protein